MVSIFPECPRPMTSSTPGSAVHPPNHSRKATSATRSSSCLERRFIAQGPAPYSPTEWVHSVLQQSSTAQHKDRRRVQGSKNAGNPTLESKSEPAIHRLLFPLSRAKMLAALKRKLANWASVIFSFCTRVHPSEHSACVCRC